MEVFGPKTPDEIRNQHNLRGIELFNESIERQKKHIFQLSKGAISDFLIQDRANNDMVDRGELKVGGSIPIYVFRHTVSVPMNRGEFVQTRSILFETQRVGRSKVHKMRIHVLCDESGDVLEENNEVYVERYMKDGSAEYISLQEGTMYHYLAESQTEDNEGYVSIGDINMALLYDRVNDEASIITEIFGDMINGQVVSQKEFTITEEWCR